MLAKPNSKADTLNTLSTLIKRRFPNQSGIVYVLSQKDAEEVAGHLQNQGLKSAFYHAEIASSVRSSTHKRWIIGDIRIVVATIAFGMGIDKPNVRFVIHHCMSKTLENYYQVSV